MKDKKKKPSRDLDIRNIYEMYLERVFAYVAYRVGNVKDTEDIVSEIFLSISRSELVDLRNGMISLDAWVFTIARNKVIDFYRKKNRKPILLSLDDLPDLSSNHTEPEDHILSKERFIILHRLINNLPKRQREIIHLRFFGWLKNKDIANLLGIKERTVSAYLTRAIEQLERDYATAQHEDLSEEASDASANKA